MLRTFQMARIRFARVCSHVMTLMLEKIVLLLDFSNRVIGIISFEKAFSKFYRRNQELVSKFIVGLKSLFTSRPTRI